MNCKNSSPYYKILQAPFIIKYLARYADFLLISGTGILLSLNILTSLAYYKELTNQFFQNSFSNDEESIVLIIKSIIGKNLTLFDFFYLAVYQFSAILRFQFRIRYILFLVYLQLCKIFLSADVSKNLIIANLGIQTILALQIFLIVFNLDLKRSIEQDSDNSIIY